MKNIKIEFKLSVKIIEILSIFILLLIWRCLDNVIETNLHLIIGFVFLILYALYIFKFKEKILEWKLNSFLKNNNELIIREK